MEYNEEYLMKMDDIAGKAASDYADYVFALKIFESVSKDFLASLKMEIRSQFKEEKFSESELETRARADERWKEFRKEEILFLKEAGRRQIRYESCQRRFEAARSGLSLKKKEMERL